MPLSIAYGLWVTLRSIPRHDRIILIYRRKSRPLSYTQQLVCKFKHLTIKQSKECLTQSYIRSLHKPVENEDHPNYWLWWVLLQYWYSSRNRTFWLVHYGIHIELGDWETYHFCGCEVTYTELTFLTTHPDTSDSCRHTSVPSKTSWEAWTSQIRLLLVLLEII